MPRSHPTTEILKQIQMMTIHEVITNVQANMLQPDLLLYHLVVLNTKLRIHGMDQQSIQVIQHTDFVCDVMDCVCDVMDCVCHRTLHPEARLCALRCLQHVIRHGPQLVDIRLLKTLLRALSHPLLRQVAAEMITYVAGLKDKFKEGFKTLGIGEKITDMAFDRCHEKDYGYIVKMAEKVYSKNMDIPCSRIKTRKQDFIGVVLWLLSDALEHGRMDNLSSTLERWMPVLSQTLTESVDNDTQAGGLACKVLGLVFRRLPGPSPRTVLQAGLVPHILKHLRSQSTQVVLRTLKCIAFIVNAVWPDHPSVCREFIEENVLEDLSVLVHRERTCEAAFIVLELLMLGAGTDFVRGRAPRSLSLAVLLTQHVLGLKAILKDITIE